MAKKTLSVERILSSYGPMLTSDVSALYRKQGVGAEAARQRVSRRSDAVKTLKGLSFPKNARFLYLEGDFGSSRFFTALIKKLQETSPAYSSAISGLTARGGICFQDYWHIASGSPVLQTGHVASEEILNRLLNVKLFSRENIAGIGHCIVLSDGFTVPNYAAFRTRMTLEQILIETVKNWAIRTGFSSENAIMVRSPSRLPEFSTHRFDIVGPCFLQALMKHNNGKLKHDFFVADVIWNNELRESDVIAFLRKVATLKSLRKLMTFQPMLVANGFTHEALMLCRSKGIMAVTPDTLLGRDVAQGLMELFDTLERAAAIAIGNPEKIQLMFDNLSQIDGLAGNMRVAMFEMIVTHIVKSLNAGSADIGEIVTDYQTKGKADIDVRLVQPDKVICYECKGHASHIEVTLEDVKYWLEKQVPIIRAAQNAESRFNNKRMVFEFWTTGTYEVDALEYLEKRKKATNKYDIDWRDGAYVLTESRRLETDMITKTLKTHYFTKTPAEVLGVL